MLIRKELIKLAEEKYVEYCMDTVPIQLIASLGGSEYRNLRLSFNRKNSFCTSLTDAGVCV